MSLANKYRPRSFGALIGQEKAVRKMLLAAGPEFTGKAWWISGKKGTGKSTLAGLAAATVADALDDAEHPAGKRIRRLLVTHQEKEHFAATGDFSKRSSWTRPRWIGSWRCVIRRRIGRMFGRSWRAVYPPEALA